MRCVVWWMEAVFCSKLSTYLQNRGVCTGGLPWLKRIIVDFLLRKPGLSTRAVLVGFVVDKVTQTGFRQIVQLSIVSVIPWVLHTDVI